MLTYLANLIKQFEMRVLYQLDEGLTQDGREEI